MKFTSEVHVLTFALRIGFAVADKFYRTTPTYSGRRSRAGARAGEAAMKCA
jgi:hypothetical protein